MEKYTFSSCMFYNYLENVPLSFFTVKTNYNVESYIPTQSIGLHNIPRVESVHCNSKCARWTVKRKAYCNWNYSPGIKKWKSYIATQSIHGELISWKLTLLPKLFSRTKKTMQCVRCTEKWNVYIVTNRVQFAWSTEKWKVYIATNTPTVQCARSIDKLKLYIATNSVQCARSTEKWKAYISTISVQCARSTEKRKAYIATNNMHEQPRSGKLTLQSSICMHGQPTGGKFTLQRSWMGSLHCNCIQ